MKVLSIKIKKKFETKQGLHFPTRIAPPPPSDPPSTRTHAHSSPAWLPRTPVSACRSPPTRRSSHFPSPARGCSPPLLVLVLVAARKEGSVVWCCVGVHQPNPEIRLRKEGDKAGCPRIGNNCWIAAGGARFRVRLGFA